MRERVGSDLEGVVVEPPILLLLGERPTDMTRGRVAITTAIFQNAGELHQGPGHPDVVRPDRRGRPVKGEPLVPGAVRILHAHQPVSGAHCGGEPPAVERFAEQTAQPEQDLPRIEDRRPSRGIRAVVEAGLERAVRHLDAQEPLAHSHSAVSKVWGVGQSGVVEKGRDDVSRGLRVGRFPTPDQGVPGSDTPDSAGVLGTAQPGHGLTQVLGRVSNGTAYAGDVA